MVGNHRDAWVFGASDPNSGTASLHEVVKGFGQLIKEGWKPLRTIVVASWDAEEYGLVGSTEFGEDYGEWSKKVVAYLNVDECDSKSSSYATCAECVLLRSCLWIYVYSQCQPLACRSFRQCLRHRRTP